MRSAAPVPPATWSRRSVATPGHTGCSRIPAIRSTSSVTYSVFRSCNRATGSALDRQHGGTGRGVQGGNVKSAVGCMIACVQGGGREGDRSIFFKRSCQFPCGQGRTVGGFGEDPRLILVYVAVGVAQHLGCGGSAGKRDGARAKCDGTGASLDVSKCYDRCCQTRQWVHMGRAGRRGMPNSESRSGRGPRVNARDCARVQWQSPSQHKAATDLADGRDLKA